MRFKWKIAYNVTLSNNKRETVGFANTSNRLMTLGFPLDKVMPV